MILFHEHAKREDGHGLLHAKNTTGDRHVSDATEMTGCGPSAAGTLLRLPFLPYDGVGTCWQEEAGCGGLRLKAPPSGCLASQRGVLLAWPGVHSGLLGFL